MKKRVEFAGGDADGRLSKSKLTSLKKAIKNSYQAEWITFNSQVMRCLINPDRLKEDYDQKVISIEFDSKISVGDTFYWNRTNSFWIVYLQELSEEAYFRAAIRKCNYYIEIKKNKYWMYLKGPTETNIKWEQKHNIAFNDLNYSISIYITKNAETLELFKRHSIIKFDNHNWQVAAIDKYSQEGVLEVTLNEYFDNSMEDARVTPEIIKLDKELPYIDGLQSVEPYSESLVYFIKNTTGGEFVVNSSKVEVVSSNEISCTINILTGKSGSFIITYVRPPIITIVDEIEVSTPQDDIILSVVIESF